MVHQKSSHHLVACFAPRVYSSATTLSLHQHLPNLKYDALELRDLISYIHLPKIVVMPVMHLLVLL